MAYILSIETSTKVCSVALHNKGELAGFKESYVPNSHSELINIFIDEVLKEANVEMNQLDAGFDAEDIAFILNDKGIKKRNKEWTTNSISNIVNNLKRKRNDIEQTVTVDNNTYIEGLKRRRTKNKKIFNGKTGQAHDLLQNQVTNDFETSTI